MSLKRILLAVVLFDFLLLNAYAVYQLGYVGVFQSALGSLGGIAAFVDLAIALSLIALWLVRDAREKGISPIPYLALTLTLGSVGPLLYLLRRPEDEPRALVAAPARV